MPYAPHFIAINFALRLRDMSDGDAIEVRCLCGGGPWLYLREDLVERHGIHESCQWLVDAMTCRRCGARFGLTWQTMRPESDA